MNLNLSVRQLSLDEFCPLTEAVEKLAREGSVEARGAIYTRVEVVEFILDLSGYVPSQPLYRLRLLEPSFGAGDFLLPAIDRLLTAWGEADLSVAPVNSLGDAIRAVELHEDSYAQTRELVIARLVLAGIDAQSATQIADKWLIHGDFLLSDLPFSFDFVVGNPPYVRQESIPPVLLAEYRQRFSTLYDRADLYVAFIERALLLLDHGGTLGFICADRWTKNRYGGPLRSLISSSFHLRFYIDMSRTQAFRSEVDAYPAITVISREKAGPTRVAHNPQVDSVGLTSLAAELCADKVAADANVKEVAALAYGAGGDAPWVFGKSEYIELLRRLEQALPTIEATGCTVGIGVATGCDKAFIADFESLDVEDDCKLPLVMTRDIHDGTVEWRGKGVVNPFAKDGRLVELKDYPRLRRYLEERRSDIAARHCAQKSPANWYRTIDRITPALAYREKLLIPDIKGDTHIVYEAGCFYPHHNLYYVVSDEWNLRALQALLLSRVTRFFIAAYSTRMRGGFLRFQAQYLRRIRIPNWQDVSLPMREKLLAAANTLDIQACNDAAYELYGLSQAEIKILENT